MNDYKIIELLCNDIFNFFSYKPRVSHGAIAVQPLRGWQYKTPTGFNRNNPALQRGDNKRINKKSLIIKTNYERL